MRNLVLIVSLILGIVHFPLPSIAQDVFSQRDLNGDGRLTKDELPVNIRQNFERVDRDRDGFISRDEDAEFRRTREGKSSAPRESTFQVIKDLAYVVDGHPRQVLDLYLPKSMPSPKPPLVVFIHGGGFKSGSKENAPIAPLVEAGFAAAAINYRLSGHATFPAQIHDCKAAIRWLRSQAEDYGYDGSKIGVFGTSAGGHLVALLGTSGEVKELEGDLGRLDVSSRVQAVCDHFGPIDFTTMDEQAGPLSQIKHLAPESPESLLLGGPVPEKQAAAKSASPLTYVSSDDPPFYIVHGDQDRLVPVQQSETLHAKLVDMGVESRIRIVKGAGHGGFRDPDIVPSMIAFFREKLNSKNITNRSAKELAPPYFHVRYPGSKEPNELVYAVNYTLWIPPGVAKLRGIVVHQHGCGEGACRAGATAAFDLHWQALAKKHACALLGPSFEQPEKADCRLWCDPRHGSEQVFLRALDDLAERSGHAELTSVPWALWGHSGGATWVGSMLLLHPERVAAAWLRSGAPRMNPEENRLPPMSIPTESLKVPIMCNLGTKEGVTVEDARFGKVWDNVSLFFGKLREQGGTIGVSVDPLSSHDCGNQRYLAVRWFDACLAARLPSDVSMKMQPMNEQDAWYAEPTGATAFSSNTFQGDKLKAAWLPNEAIARAWQEYVKDTNIVDTTPPPAPTAVRLMNGELTWQAEADLESGIAAFIIERNGSEIGRLPEKVEKSIGRPIFQKNNYSDTPSQPLSEMRFFVGNEGNTTDTRYTVVSINSVGLRSEATTASR